MSATMTLTGWTHVHTWMEPHGNGRDDVYQSAARRWDGRVDLLTISTRRGHSEQVRVEISSHDHQLAREIMQDDTGRYAKDGARYTSPCCTAGHDDWTDTATGAVYRIVSVAGHGSYAYKMDDQDLA